MLSDVNTSIGILGFLTAKSGATMVISSSLARQS